MKKFFSVISILFFITAVASAQAPANDECENAIEITLDINTCSNTINGTTQNATQSNTAPTPSCDFAGGAYDDDVWYKFTAAQSGIVQIEFSNINGGTDGYLSVAIASGTDCSSLSEVTCSWAVPTGSRLTLRVSQGTIYYMRLFSPSNNPAEYKSFSFCAYLISNDECSTAKELTVGNLNNYGAYGQYGTTDGGTESSTTPLPSCAADGINDDVWYKFTATSSVNSFIRLFNASSNNISLQVYEGNCSGLNLLDCATASINSSYVNINAVSGNTYYIRVFTTDPTPAVFSNFYIYAYTLTPVPANDDCDNAAEIILGDGICGTQANVNTLGATASNNTPPPACDAAGTDDDVWYKFTSAENRPVRFEINNPNFSSNNSGITVQVYEGTCGVFTPASCNSFAGYICCPGVFSFQINTTAATEYFLRVFTTENDPTKFTQGNICAFYLPLPPVNDECIDAVVLTPELTSQCASPVAGTSIGATASGQAGPGCFGANADDDVWYKFAATSANQIITVLPAMVTGIQGYTAFQVFSGNCGTLTELNCVVSNATDGPAQQVITNLTVGDTFYVRVYSLFDEYTYKGDFTICITTPNDDCFHAEELTINPSSSCDVVTNGNTTFGGNGGNADCTSQTFVYIDDAVWYKFTATSNSQKITVTPAATFGVDDIAFQLLEGADCNSLNINACINNSTGNSAEENTFTGLIIGNTYYLKVYSQEYSFTTRGAFSVCLSSNNNDECESAVSVPVNLHKTCDEVITGTTTGATQSLMAACVGFNDDDVWYKFTAISNTQKITVTPAQTNGIDDIVLETFYGDCSGLGTAYCVNNTIGSSAEEKFLTGLVPGSVYYFRVYSAGFASGNGDFSVCITSYTDNCNYVDTLIANPDENCAVQTAGSTVITGAGGGPGCAGDADDNSWYLFQATATNHIIKVTPASVNGIDDAVIEVFNGACGGLNSIACANNTSGNAVEEATLTGLNIGYWYYVRVYSQAAGSGEGSYDICVTTSTAAPANDECINAISINGSVNPTLLCNILVRGSNYFATNSSLLNCAGQAVNDVWYAFTALSTTQRINVTAAFPNGINNPSVQAFSGSCNSLVSLGCSSFGNSLTISTIPGNVYYVRVYGDGTNQGEFDLCITTPYIFSDDCLGALTVPVNNDNTCGVTTGSTTINSSSSGLAGCTGNYADDDVWLKFTASANAHTITVNPATTGGITDAVLEVYSGSCTSFSDLTCANNTTGSAAESLVAQNLTPGNTYFIRVYSAGTGAGNSGAFTVCINGTLENDDCSGAITIPINNDGSCTNTFTGSSAGSTASNDIPFCNGGGTGGGSYDVWYKFIAGATAYNISVTPSASGGIVNPRWQLMSGSCGNLVSLGCAGNALTFENLVPGNTYYLLVNSNNGNIASSGSFNICVKSITLANDVCSGAVDIPVSNDVTCITSITGTTSGALNSVSNGIKDVWYKFTATETAHKVKVSPVADSIRNVAFEIYQGNCNSLSSLLQVNNNASPFDADTTKGEIQSVENLTIGNTYYIRVYSAGVFRPITVDVAGSFNICVSLSANDVCSKAIEVPVNAGPDCITVTLDSLDNATVTPGTSYCNIVNSNLIKDVWFKFTALDTLQLITVNQRGFQLFSGDCGNLTSILCGGPREIIGSLLVGNTYYVRVYTGTNNATAKFSICISKGAINNECGGAISLPVNTNPGCAVTTNGSTRGSTVSANYTCSNFYNYPGFGSPPVPLFGNDVWYKFVATSAQHKVTVTGTTADMNLFLTVYAGNCDALNQIVCINDYRPAVLGAADEEAVSLDNLTIGNTYYVRVYNQAFTNEGADFTICVSDVDPLNDLCSNAITVPVNSGDNCTQTVTGSNMTATRSYDAPYLNNPIVTCPENASADVFYKFIATAASLKIKVTPTASGGIDDVMFQVYSGNCGSLSQIAWADFTSGNREEITRIENLIIGDTYYISVLNASGERSARGSFTICINEPPLNDLCTGAVSLDVNSDNNCTLQTAGTTVGATPINGNEDVWYQFIATASEHRITITAGSLPNPAFALYKGNCNNLVQIRENMDYDAAGSNIEFHAYDSLTIGNTYYIRVWSVPPTVGSCSKFANVNITGTFSICVSAPTMPNDLIDGAVSLAVNSGSDCVNSVVTNNIGSSYSYNRKDCYNPTNYFQREYISDVWFKFTATATSHIISVTPEVSSGIKNPAFAVYERPNDNNGDNLLSRGCVNFADNNAAESQSFNGLVPGKAYYIRVMSDIHTNNQGYFNICITTPSLPAYTSKIITYAGDGTGEGISVTNSKLFSPTDVATDNQGNVYIADSARIKKISLADGTVTIVAGTGVPGVSGDNGPATSAQIPLKVKIAVDNSGNVFIADYEVVIGTDSAYISRYGTVRKVNASTGIISKIIDMPIDLIDIIKSPFTPTVYIYKNRQLTGITTDATGNIFITVNWQEPLGNSAFIRPGAKHYNVYKQTPGGTFSELYFGDHFGYGLGIDGTGNLYVAAAEGVSPCVTNGGGIGPCFDGTPEYYDTRHIRKITPGSGSSIIAGKRLTGVLIGVGPFGYTGDGGPAVDAQLKPIDVKTDAEGNVYIADGYGYGFGNGAEYGNYAIRKINTAGVITTIAGTGVNTYSGDGGPASLAAIRTPLAIAVDASGNIYVADVKENESPLTAGNRIRKIIADCSGGIAMSNKGNTFYVTGEKTIYKECDTIAKVVPVAPVVFNRDVTAKVWIETTVPVYSGQPYVARHYEINPLTDPSAATTRLTLYFTQTEFDNYNALVGPGSKLPLDATDATNYKPRLVVIQREGVSNNGSGLQEAYTGASVTVNPNDNDIVWNSSQNRWEVTITVTGGGGFFVQTIPDCPVNTWTSAANNGNWNDASNWCNAVVPNGATDAIIPTDATPYPTLNTNAAINHLEIQAGATVSTGSYTFTINGTMNGTGTLSGSPSSSIITNASTTLLFTPGSNTIKDLTVNAGTTTLGNALNITAGSATPNSTGTVTVSTGAVLASNGNLTFKSNEFGTARLAQGSDAGNFVTGNATLERYIPNNNFRSWRLLSVPTHSSGQTIRQAWQEGDANPSPQQNNLADYGTQITGTGNLAAAQAAGFDNVAANAAMLYWNVNAWSPVTNTNTAIDNKKAYFLYVRGERSKGVTGAVTNSSATTLRTSGSLYTGNQSTTVPANSFTVVPNLYASAIDFTGLTRSGVANLFYIWDSKKLNGSSLGVYQTFSGTNNYNCLVSGGSYVLGQPNTLIESGQAFFVQGNSTGGSIVLHESSKRNGSTGLGFRPAPSSVSKLETRLYDADGTNMRDAASIVFDNAYSNAVEEEDAPKIGNPGENFAIENQNKILAVEGRKPLKDVDAIQFRMWNLKQQQYKLELAPLNINSEGLTAVLEDSYLKTSTPVDFTTVATFSFVVDANAGSSAANRFRVVLNKTKPKIFDTKEGYTIAPNPVENGIVNVQFKNQPQGKYYVRVMSATGQVLAAKAIAHAGGSALQTIALPPAISQGHYKVEIIAPGKSAETISLLVNK